MTCPKCNKETLAEWVYCPFCQNPLKTKCSECGRMELIGRLICETKLAEIKKELKDYKTKNVGKWKFRIMEAISLTTMLGGIVLLLIFLENEVNSKILLPFLCLFIWPVLSVFALSIIIFKTDQWRERAKEKAEQEFFKLHPEYAEIIKKAEGK